MLPIEAGFVVFWAVALASSGASDETETEVTADAAPGSMAEVVNERASNGLVDVVAIPKRPVTDPIGSLVDASSVRSCLSLSP